MLATSNALKHATDLIDLHLAEYRIRLLLEAPCEQVITVLVTGRPGTFLQAATCLLDALPEDEQSKVHEVRALLENTTT